MVVEVNFENQESKEKEIPKETEQQEEEQQRQPKKVSAFDPDFILMFFFAAGSDLLDVFFDLITTLTEIPVPKIIGEGVDLITAIVIRFWLYHRTKQIAVARRGAKVGLKVLVKIGIASLIEEGSGLGLGITSWIGVFPSWTITVISALF